MQFFMITVNISWEEWEFHTEKKNVNIVSIAVDAPQDVISAMSGKIGKIDGVSVKTAYSNVITNE